MQHSGSLRYYAGRLTLRYDQLDPDWLDRGVDWLRARGIASYALLDEWEVPEFRRRFPGQAVIRQLETPLWEFRRQRTVYVYDLSRDLAAPPEPVDRSDVFSRMHRCDPAVPLMVPVVIEPALSERAGARAGCYRRICAIRALTSRLTRAADGCRSSGNRTVPVDVS